MPKLPTWTQEATRRRPLWIYVTISFGAFLLLSTTAAVHHEKARNIANKVVNEISAKVIGELSNSDLVAAFGCHRAFPEYEAPSEDDYTFRTHANPAAKVLVLQICTNPNTMVAFPLKTHEDYARLHGYSYLARRRPFPHADYSEEMLSLDSYWDKVKILQEVMEAQMAKPAEERVEWLFFTDSDTIVLNQLIRIEDILPPADKAPHVQMVIGRDGWGVNAGVFFLRVSDWSQQFIKDWLYHGSRTPGWLIPLREQSLLQLFLPLDEVVVIEKYWFNAWGKPNPHEANRGWGEAGPDTFNAHFNGEAKMFMKDYEHYLTVPGFGAGWKAAADQAREALAEIWSQYWERRHA